MQIAFFFFGKTGPAVHFCDAAAISLAEGENEPERTVSA